MDKNIETKPNTAIEARLEDVSDEALLRAAGHDMAQPTQTGGCHVTIPPVVCRP